MARTCSGSPNQFNKLTRDNVDLSVSTTFQAWESNLAGKQKEDLTAN